MNLSLNQIKEMLEIIKPIKDFYMYISSTGTVYSTDEYYSYLKVLQTNILGYEFSFNFNELTSLIKMIEKHDLSFNVKMDFFGNTFMCPSDRVEPVAVKKNMVEDEWVSPVIVSTHIPLFMNLIGKVSMYNINNNYDYYTSTLREDENFNSIISQKAADGVSLFKLDDNYLMTICARFFPINKKDKVDFYIKRIDNNRSFANMKIYKSKTCMIDMYIVILNL